MTKAYEISLKFTQIVSKFVTDSLKIEAAEFKQSRTVRFKVA